MKFDINKFKAVSKPLPDKEREQMEFQIENREWLALSVKLAVKIRSIMDAEGISRAELARRMRVSQAQVSKILSGRENLGLKTIAKIQSALGKALFQIEDYNNSSATDTVGYIPGSMLLKDLNVSFTSDIS